MTLSAITSTYEKAMTFISKLDGIAPLFLRLYLAPIFIQAGWNKLSNFDSTVQWFGNADWGLGLPFPELLAALASGAEFFGGWLLLLGLFTRLISIPLMVTMLVAAFSVHIENGWLALADASSWLADGTIFHNESIMAAVEKKQMAIEILQKHGNYEWLTSSGNFTILNNGIEFSITYFIMLLVLFFFGAGRYTSVDHYLAKRFFPQK
ncbi:DoxD-like inner membrane protein [Psychrosphaera saromensis]|uniref:HvfX family Cu-binding RiPP maturation protein n=1 Tax=Psychrosphaera saromensis TaxID=716813 RepID=UPI0015E3A688|nr:DoxX family protein [Psychrosphaera saromensis]GHB74266.1 DoxD-like inner membrane protein [Psychrosphaera saromensis]GLQ12567.1 DoxD-like inner membrane protein [Psychrosphaera saromensis]